MVEVGGIKVVDAGIPGGVQKGFRPGLIDLPLGGGGQPHTAVPQQGGAHPGFAPITVFHTQFCGGWLLSPPYLLFMYSIPWAKQNEKCPHSGFQAQERGGDMPWFFLQSAGEYDTLIHTFWQESV